MILHLAWKFVRKLSPSWLLIPQNLLILSNQLMNNCSDWELFGNNLSCKKRGEKTQHLLEKKKHPYWVEGVFIDEEEGDCLRHLLSYCCTCNCLLQKNPCLGFFENGPFYLRKKNKETKVVWFCINVAFKI